MQCPVCGEVYRSPGYRALLRCPVEGAKLRPQKEHYLRPGIEKFLRSDWFTFLCESLDLEPAWAASVIRSGTRRSRSDQFKVASCL